MNPREADPHAQPSSEQTSIRDEDTFTPTTSMLPPPMPAEHEHSRRWARPSLVEMRRSLLSIPLFKPRWKPWSPARVVSTTLAFASVMALLVLMLRPVRNVGRWFAHLSERGIAASAAGATDEEPTVTPSLAPPPRADAALSREHRSPIAGGLLMIPPAFRSLDGAYDLVIHFHGNTDLVEESFVTSGIGAVLVTMNHGNGSGVYEDRYANPLVLSDVLDRVQATLEKRGLEHAKLRRLALTAWSAGYGAVLEILTRPALAEKVDAVILLDGIHVGYRAGTSEPQLDRLMPFERFAREAMEGKKLFTITHSDITPVGHYAGTRETTDALLRSIGVDRQSGGEAPAMPALHSIEGVIARKKIVKLVPETFVAKGELRVRGYAGDQPEDHMAHLIHMTTAALPDLAARWNQPGSR
jgi:hypothetical protein